MLEAKGLRTVEDLLCYVPFRYEDRSNMKTIAQLAPGEMATVVAEVRSARVAGFRRRNLGLFEATFTDASRAVLAAKWFHSAYLGGVIAPGQRIALYGKVEFDSYSGELSMLHPEYELLSGDDEDGDAALHVGRVVPIYEAVAKLNTRLLRTLTHRILNSIGPQEDHLPPVPMRHQLALPDRWRAVRDIHFPPPDTDLRLLNSFRSPAHLRLIFEEFFWLELGLALKKDEARARVGIAFQLNERVREKIKAMLPFKPTAAQKRVLGEIAQDMAAPRPMSRLLQGDVGSGKTIVAAEAAVIAVENGYQAALLAPTEILATQHYLYLKPLLTKLGYVAGLFTGSFTSREKTQLKKLLAEGLIHVAVGTHALLEKDVEFHKLGLAIVDEQHRFGVMQRFELLAKGAHPDVLVMTATPIPRTLALTLYGDLDVSVLDELPPGRTPIVTRRVSDERSDEVWDFVRKQIAAGHQAYVVYPVIQENEENELKAAIKMYKELSNKIFADLKVGLLHGKLDSDLKEHVMRLFQQGELNILVATTVIEVGVDVPHATVMVIEHAERFGLSQLHQLRGRIGRGAAKSFCILMTGGKVSEEGERRLDTMVRTSDGFQIAETDLELRGPGEFFGTRQAGMPNFRVANLIRDRQLLELAKREAAAVMAGPNDEVTEVEISRALVAMRTRWQHTYGLVEVA